MSAAPGIGEITTRVWYWNSYFTSELEARDNR